MPAVGFPAALTSPSIQNNLFSPGSLMQPTYAANSAINIESLGQEPSFVANMKAPGGPKFRKHLKAAKQAARREKTDHAKKCTNGVGDLKKMARMINTPGVKKLSSENMAQNLETLNRLTREVDMDCRAGQDIPLNSEKCTTTAEAELMAEINYNNIINANHQIKMEKKRSIFVGEVNLAVGKISHSTLPVPGEGFIKLDEQPDWETPIPGLLKDEARCEANIALATNLNTTLYQRFTHELTTIIELCPLVIRTGQQLLRAANKMV